MHAMPQNKQTELLKELIVMSNRYGSDPDLVLAGGGNTSAKDSETLYVKASGTSLATITEDGFVAMDRGQLEGILKKEYPSNDKEREAAFLEDVLAAKSNPADTKRPSVEALLHNLFPHRFVLHLHPALVNGLTCGVNGEEIAKALFSDEALWVEECRPGYTLAKLCNDRMNDYFQKFGKHVRVLLLQNHGVFFAGDTLEQIDELLNKVMSRLKDKIVREPDLSSVAVDGAVVKKMGKRLSALNGSIVIHGAHADAMKFSADAQSVAPLLEPFTPDHIVYCKAHPLYIDNIENMSEDYKDFRSKNGYDPKIVIVKGMGYFALGTSEKDAKTAKMLFDDAMKIAVYSESFGGQRHMAEDMVNFITNWEAESYRQSQNK